MDQLKPQALKYRWEQGFIDQHGVFYSREQAWEIAEFRNQIVRELPATGKLYSEHLYWKANIMAVTLEEALEMVKQLEAHLDYCGWGDSWERECAEPLMKELEEFKARAEVPSCG
jgi:hypothetical protein